MKYRFLPPALAELDEAAHYYDQERQGLGDEFLEEIEQSISRILGFPEAWGEMSPQIRRCLTRRFPYGIVYQILDQEILIVAVMHLKRRPMYWQDRIQ